MAAASHLGFDTKMNRKDSHTNEISVFKLVKNEILGLFCQKKDGRRRPFWIYENKHIKENKRADANDITHL